ncbi:MAG TPA: ABC transporter substrate-binding protein [Candidatus Omnitrophota bacterium]|nr:ABC transporter substrate-binding protein [Candidatus Omnitrophota bacterium]
MSALGAAALLAFATGPAHADTRQDARAFIMNLADTAMNTVAIKSIDDAERNRRFRTLFVNTFDLPEIGKMVLGRYWRIATPEQQQEFLRLFEEVQVLTWAKRFNDYSGETLEIVAVNPEGETNVAIDSLIHRSKQDPLQVAWLLRKTDGSFRVLDIKVEGASMALTYRSDYGAVIQASGGKIEGLLNALRKKVGQLGGDAATATAQR